MVRTWWQYAVLVVLFVCGAYYETGSLAYLVRTIRHPAAAPAPPFSIRNATRIIGTGPLFGDQILSLNGRPFTAKFQYDEAVAHAHPGDKLRLVLSEPSGRAIETSVVVGDKVSALDSADKIALVLCLNVLVPIVCLVLGFAVAFIRPHDKNAWFLLFLLLGFSGLVGGSDWYASLPDLQLLWDAFCNSVWATAMVLFALYFPARSEFDRRLPWLKYIFLVPSAVVQMVLWGILWIWVHSISAAENLHSLYVGMAPASLVIQLFGVSAFFLILGFKSASKLPADDLRRLRILRAGATVSLAPMGLIAVYAVIRHTDILAGISWPVQSFAFFMMAVFPLTLAYVIVVERAMDLSFVVRQSVQYGLAKGGVRVLRIALIVIFVNLLVNSAHGATAASWVRTLGIGLFGLVLFRQRLVNSASTWVDRKFFREAYDAEVVLSELAVEAGRYVEIDPLLEKVAKRISDTLHVADIVILVRDGDFYRTRYSTRMGQPMDVNAGSRLLAAPGEQAIPLEVDFDNPQPWLRALDAEELQTLDFMRSELLLALRGRGSESGKIVGIMSLGRKMSDVPYSKTDIRLLQAIAVQMGMALENSRLAASLADEAAHREVLNRELEIAREVQERLFPQKFPKVAGVDCFGYCRPARGVGGDYYDFVEQADGKLGIAIGDVSGKGIAAALLMASLQASLRGQAMAGIHDLAELMRNVNKLVYDASQSNRYATFFYGEFDSASRRLAYVNAGHNPPLVLRGAEVIRLEASGPVVGLLPGVGYSMDSFELQPGDVLVGYTDGISEAMNEQDEEWEEERFIAAARDCAAGTAKEMIHGIFRCADAFTGNAKQYDDMTLLIVKLAS